MAGIRLDGIRKSFGETRVLGGVDLDIRDGEFLTLVGPSGCGKSTLLRIIAGLEQQDSGSLHIGEREVSKVRPSERDLAMVFQSYALYPHLTVAQNMATPLRLRDLNLAERLPLIGLGMPGRRAKLRDIGRRVAETAATLKIDHLLGRKPGQLSGGQRQRVALGRAMVRKPVAFLMDEPLSNLDAALRVHMRSELAELHRALATTFIYVTHDQAEALTMSDRIAVMMEGDILQLGTPSEIYGDPLDERVASFIGSPRINLIAGRADGEGRVSFAGTTLQRRVALADADVTVGIRPEHLELCDQAEDALTARVTHVENLGADMFLHGRLADDTPVILRALPEAAQGLIPGSTVHARQTRGAALVFGADRKRVAFHGGERWVA